jgi:transposase-like protein
MTSKTTNRFSPEVRQRAVRMVRDHEADQPARWEQQAEPWSFHIA